MADRRLLGRIARLVERKPVQAALHRRECRHRRAPGQTVGLGSDIRRMERGEISKVGRGYGHDPHPVVHIAGMNGKEGGGQPEDLAVEPEARLMAQPPQPGHLLIKRAEAARIDGDRHLMITEPCDAAFDRVCRLVELALDGHRHILGGFHLRRLAARAFRDQLSVDRREAVRDHGVAHGTDGVEHAGPGRSGIGAHMKDGGITRLPCPVGDVEMSIAESDRPARCVFCNQRLCAAKDRFEHAGGQGREEPDQGSIGYLQAAGRNTEAGLEDGHDFAQLVRATARVLAKECLRPAPEQRHLQRRRQAAHHGDDHDWFLQALPREMPLPCGLDIGRKALTHQGSHPRGGLAHQAVHIEGETRVEPAQQFCELCPKGHDRLRRGRDAVDAGDLEGKH